VSADVLYGLSAAVGFGSADFLSRGVSHRIGFQSTLFYLQLIGGVGLLPLCLVFERSLWHASDPWAFIAALSLLNLTGSLALYRAFEQGVVSVVAPVIAMAPAIATVLAIVGLGERPTPADLAGIAIVLAGTVSLSRSAGLVAGPEPRDSRAGLISAFVAMVALGLVAVGAKVAVISVGPISTIVVLRLINVGLVLFAVVLGRVRLARPAPAVWPAVLTMTILDSAAFVAYTTGISVGSVALVSTLSGSFSAVTVALAALILRERLSRVAYASIGVMLAGVTLIVGL
jgi:drug/metabolite transporter (DMT)-like permease